MDSQKRLEFFKNKIKEKLESIKDDIPEIRYKLWVASVDACDSYDVLREMAELDMQLDMFEYTRNEINPKLEKLNMGIEELREGKSIAIKSTDTPNKDNKDFSLEIMDIGPVINYSAEDILQDIEDPEIDAAMASLLMSRLATEPIEESLRDELLDSLNETGPSLDDIDNISDEELDEIGDVGESLELNDDDFSISEDELFSEDEITEDKNESLFDDFSDIKTEVIESSQTEGIESVEDFDPFDIPDDEISNELDETSDDMKEDTEDFDPFDISDEDLDEIESDTENESDTEDFDPFDISDEDLDDLGEDEENEDFDPFGNLDEDDFGDLDEDEESEESDDPFGDLSDADFGDLGDDSTSEDDDPFGNLDEDDFGDLDDTEDPFNTQIKDEASFDELENAGDIFDSIDEDDLGDIDTDEESEDAEDKDPFSDIDLDEENFGDLGDDIDTDEESEDDSDDPFGDLDGLEDFVEDDEPKIEDDSDEFFSKPKSESKGKKDTTSQTKRTREIKPTAIFDNGTSRGKQTQEMFTNINKIGSLFSKLSTQAVKHTKKAIIAGKEKAETSGFFEFEHDDDEEIDGF